MKPGYVKDRISDPSELRLVTQVCNDAVVTNTCIVWICSCTLHRRHSRRCAELLVILLTLFFYLHHAGGIVFLTGRDVVAANAIDIAEPARTNLGGNTLATNEVVLGEAVLRNGDDWSGIDHDTYTVPLSLPQYTEQFYHFFISTFKTIITF